MSFGFGCGCWCGRRSEYDLAVAHLMFCCCLLWTYDSWSSLGVVLRFDVVVAKNDLVYVCLRNWIFAGFDLREFRPP